MHDCKLSSISRLSCLVLRQTGHNLDLLYIQLLRVFKLEFDVFDDESPDFVTEAVGVEVALRTHFQSTLVLN